MSEYIDAPDPAKTKKQLDLIAVIAVLDFLLLVVLILGVAGVLPRHPELWGPIHGVGFVLLVILTAKGAGERRWGWWFPAITVITGGPLGSLIGDVIVRRQLAEAKSS